MIQPAVSAEPRSIDDVRRAVASHSPWRHRIAVGHGVVTPGLEDTERELTRLAVPRALTGRRVLDVGCSDGFYSFACEARGAVVHAIDDESSQLTGDRRNGFEIARELRGSGVRYTRANVERIDELGLGSFDVVLLVNVLYHLENPMLAMRKLAAVTAPGGVLVLKTYFRSDVRFWVRGRCVGFDIDRRPKWWYFPSSELGGDPTNWWAPNRAGLVGLLEGAGWGDVRVRERHGDRLYVHATRPQR